MSKFGTNDKAMSDTASLVAIIIVIIAVIGMIVGSLAFFPTYKVWKQEMDGKADLAEAEWSKKIMVEEALAKKDASVYEAEAEVIHAQGVADANKIIGNSLRNIRLSKGFSQEQLAFKANIPVSQIGRIERGELNTTVSTAYNLSQILEIEFKELFEF